MRAIETGCAGTAKAPCARRGLFARVAAASLALALLSGCAVQICGDDFPYRTNSCPEDSLAPAIR